MSSLDDNTLHLFSSLSFNLLRLEARYWILLLPWERKRSRAKKEIIPKGKVPLDVYYLALE